MWIFLNDCFLSIVSKDCARDSRERCEAALEIAHRYGGIDGAHHKTWVIDQMVRALTGLGYQDWVAKQCAGEDGPETYEWNEGIAP